MNNIKEFEFGNKVVEFDISGDDVMINATEMGRIYGKEPAHFLRLESTKEFLTELQKVRFSQFNPAVSADLNAGNGHYGDENLVKSARGKENGGTWMHRIIALKFAAWLNPAFEVWIFSVLDELMQHARETNEAIKEKAKLGDRRDELIEKLQSNTDFQEYRMIEFQLRQLANRIAKSNNNQLTLFRNN